VKVGDVMNIQEVLDITSLDADKLLELENFINQCENPKHEQLIHVLHKAQHLFGYLPPNLQRHIALKLNCSSALVNGVVTFYSFFNEHKMGEFTISVCMGTACFVKGSDKIIDLVYKETKTSKGVMSDDEVFSVKDVRCIGACGLAPVLSVNEKVFGHVKGKDVADIVNIYRKEHDKN
jgi:NADH:ubiquinone oxidoreductase subunit E